MFIQSAYLTVTKAQKALSHIFFLLLFPLKNLQHLDIVHISGGGGSVVVYGECEPKSGN